VPWPRAKLAPISQKTKVAKAIRYALQRWEGLTRIVDDGRIEIDSSVVERRIRTIALNRKNPCSRGLTAAASNWAVVALLIETRRLYGVEPNAHLTDLITKIVNGHPNNQLDDLSRWAYVAARDVANGPTVVVVEQCAPGASKALVRSPTRLFRLEVRSGAKHHCAAQATFWDNPAERVPGVRGPIKLEAKPSAKEGKF
jgi:hypothetical protein